MGVGGEGCSLGAKSGSLVMGEGERGGTKKIYNCSGKEGVNVIIFLPNHLSC